ncbi:hypothetical protein GGX14DRAFT_331764, partial [Mycena pura]
WRVWIYREFKVKSSKPPRTANFPLDQPLRIFQLPEGEDKWKKHGERFLQHCVDEVNADSHPEEKKLEYSFTAPDEDQDWKLVNPFGMYATYIHINDWNRWMRHLDTFDDQRKQEGPSVRPFVAPIGQTGKMEEAMTKIAQEANQVQNHEVDANDDQHGVGKVTLEDIGVDPKKAKRAKATKVLSRRARDLGVAEGLISYDDKGVTMFVALAAEKIKNARGMRDTEESQSQVMGGITAPTIADSLGWSKKMHAFWLAVFQWLHLSGFAFGGFGLPGQKEGYSSSQMPFNLVFGTSESNSLMTRYENAWQDVLEKEQELSIRWTDLTRIYTKKVIKQPQDAGLDIRTNAGDVPIEFDHYDSATDRYTTRRFCLFPHDSKAKHFDQIPGVAAETMRAHLEEYHFLAYSIEYTLWMTTKASYLFNDLPAVKTTVHFFPFTRPLLHKAECDLDRVVIRNLYEQALAGLEDYEDALVDEYGMRNVKPKGRKPKASKGRSKKASQSAKK